MDSQFIAVLVAAAAVIAATFLLKAVLASILRLVLLAIVAFFGRREAVGAQGFDWILPYDLVLILGAAIAGWLVGGLMNFVFFRQQGFSRAVVSPLLAVAVTYLAALFVQI